MAAPECEWCTRRATYLVKAHWTILDFDDALACDMHVAAAYRHFRRRLVDGAEVAELYDVEL
jgi:hypothetical protein